MLQPARGQQGRGGGECPPGAICMGNAPSSSPGLSRLQSPACPVCGGQNLVPPLGHLPRLAGSWTGALQTGAI